MFGISTALQWYSCSNSSSSSSSRGRNGRTQLSQLHQSHVEVGRRGRGESNRRTLLRLENRRVRRGTEQDGVVPVVHGVLVPCIIRTMGHSYLYFSCPGRFVPWTFRTMDDSYINLFVPPLDDSQRYGAGRRRTCHPSANRFRVRDESPPPLSDVDSCPPGRPWTSGRLRVKWCSAVREFQMQANSWRSVTLKWASLRPLCQRCPGRWSCCRGYESLVKLGRVTRSLWPM